MDPLEPQDQRLPPCGADAETCAHLAQRRQMYTSWEFTFLSQRWQRQDPDLRPMPLPGARRRAGPQLAAKLRLSVSA
jgi:hypothetical protein